MQILLSITSYIQHYVSTNLDNIEDPFTAFEYFLEKYRTMSKACRDCPFKMADCYRRNCVAADGTPRDIVTTNRRIAGPDIRVRSDEKSS